MKKRAIILVPGFSKRVKYAAREQLVEALDHHTDGYQLTISGSAAADANEMVNIKVKSRRDHYESDIDVYEAYWGDLIPDWSLESPWQRFKRGLTLILYWATGGLFHAILDRREIPSRTIGGLLAFAFVLMLWYMTVINVLALAILGEDNTVPEWLKTALNWNPSEYAQSLEAVELAQAASDKAKAAAQEAAAALSAADDAGREAAQALADATSAASAEAAKTLEEAQDAVVPPEGLAWVGHYLVAFFASIKDWSIYIFLVGLLGLGRLEGAANIPSFLRVYLRDDPIGEDKIGVRAHTRRRVIDVLNKVYDEASGYDEVHVVAHSLGGVIAVDALAECGRDLKRTTLHTWGAMLGLLSQQDEIIEMEISKVYASEVKMNNWLDFVFKADLLGSPRPQPRVFENGQLEQDANGKLTKRLHDPIFPPTSSPPMPKRHFWDTTVHASYYRCEAVMLALVGPEDALPQAKPVPATG